MWHMDHVSYMCEETSVPWNLVVFYFNCYTMRAERISKIEDIKVQVDFFHLFVTVRNNVLHFSSYTMYIDVV